MYKKTVKAQRTPQWLTDLRLQVVQLKRNRDRLEKLLMVPQEMVAGTINTQYRTCGKASCKCMKKKDPEKHGPYHYLVTKAETKIVQTYLRDEKDINLLQNYQQYYHWQLEYRKVQKNISDVFEQMKKRKSCG